MSDMNVDVDDTEPAFTYIWAIENCPILLIPKIIVSPVFQISFLENTEWHLAIRDIDEETLEFIIVRENDNGPDFIEVVTEISLLSFEGLPVETKNYQFKIAKCDSLEYERSKDFIFETNRTECIPNDTLTLRCRMWRPKAIVCGIHLSYARSRLGLEKTTFFWCIRNFSFTQVDQVLKTFEGNRQLPLMLFVTAIEAMELVFFKILKADEFNFLRFNCEVSIIDIKGRTVISSKRMDMVTSAENDFFLCTKSEIMDSNMTLANDVLTLRCEFEIGSGIMWSKTEHSVYSPFSKIDV